MIIRIVFTILAWGLIGWFWCDIDPNKTYYWYHGMWHGLFFGVNWVRHFFWECEFKAEHYTLAYNIFYWIFSILSTISLIFGNSDKRQSIDPDERLGGCLWLFIIPIVGYLLCSLFSWSFEYDDWNTFSHVVKWIALVLEAIIITDLINTRDG